MLSLLGPYRWVAELVAILAMIAAIVGGVLRYGHVRYEAGVAYQSGRDQKEFDHFNQQIEDQKAVATKMLTDAQSTIIALQQSQALQRAQQEKQHADDLAATDAVRRSLSGRSLRVSIPIQNSGCGQGGANTLPQAPAASGSSRTEIVQLPDALQRSLVALMYEADQAEDNYRACYRHVYPDWKG